MKTISTLLFCIYQLIANAQIDAIWKGGSPGRETDWHFVPNWSTSRIPDEFSIVIIPDVSSASGNFPVISKNAGQINALIIESGANLTIPKSGSLAVESNENSLILGKLFNQGRFEFSPLPMPLKATSPAVAGGKRFIKTFSSMLQITVLYDDF